MERFLDGPVGPYRFRLHPKEEKPPDRETLWRIQSKATYRSLTTLGSIYRKWLFSKKGHMFEQMENLQWLWWLQLRHCWTNKVWPTIHTTQSLIIKFKDQNECRDHSKCHWRVIRMLLPECQWIHVSFDQLIDVLDSRGCSSNDALSLDDCFHRSACRNASMAKHRRKFTLVLKISSSSTTIRNNTNQWIEGTTIDQYSAGRFEHFIVVDTSIESSI